MEHSTNSMEEDLNKKLHWEGNNDKETYIATYRLNQPRGRFSDITKTRVENIFSSILNIGTTTTFGFHHTLLKKKPRI